MRGVMQNPDERKRREAHSGEPCSHYPDKFKTEAAHQAKLASRRRNHQRMQRQSLDYRLRALLRTIEQRCNDPRHASYRWYGGYGIKNDLTLEDLHVMWVRDGAESMRRPSVDRENGLLNYTFANCCFRELYDNQKRTWKHRSARLAARKLAHGPDVLIDGECQHSAPRILDARHIWCSRCGAIGIVDAGVEPGWMLPTGKV